MGKNWTGASAEPDTIKKVDLAWTHEGALLQWQHCRASTPVDATWLQRKRTNNGLEKRPGEGEVDSRIQSTAGGRWRWWLSPSKQSWSWGRVVCGLCATVNDKDKVKSGEIMMMTKRVKYILLSSFKQRTYCSKLLYTSKSKKARVNISCSVNSPNSYFHCSHFQFTI